MTIEDLKLELKPLSKQGVESAIAKAEQYRLLNNPKLAESICLDVLQTEPDNQKASVILLLALTDQFGQSSSKARSEALAIAGKLKDEYSRIYYAGIVHERQGSTALASGLPGSEFDAYEWYVEAMEFYQKADAVNKVSANDDPTLRWNTCVRIIQEYKLKSRPSDDRTVLLE
ncbi:MAG TPA: hypothetical protein VL728_07855 [Cyclobacteriaceae bacterium]|jgi:hypothetical protein|nr:hypothetical protein [Cyclobacteriaceae bacterium]